MRLRPVQIRATEYCNKVKYNHMCPFTSTVGGKLYHLHTLIYINIYKMTKLLYNLKNKQKEKIKNVKQRPNFTQQSPQSKALNQCLIDIRKV